MRFWRSRYTVLAIRRLLRWQFEPAARSPGPLRDRLISARGQRSGLAALWHADDMTEQPFDEPQLPDEDEAPGRQPAASPSNPPAWEARRPLILAVLGVLLVVIGLLLNRTHGTVHLTVTVVGVLLLGGAAAFVLAHPAMRSRRR